MKQTVDISRLNAASVNLRIQLCPYSRRHCFDVGFWMHSPFLWRGPAMGRLFEAKFKLDATPPGAVCLHRDTTEPRKDDR